MNKLIILFLAICMSSLAAVPMANANEDDPGCDADNDLWNGVCTLAAYQGCTSENQIEEQCLPNVSNVVTHLGMLEELNVDKDKHTWKGARVRPGDNLLVPPWVDPLYYASKRHVQSIQYIANLPDRYIVTSLSDEHTNKAAIQLIKTKRFGSEKDGTDSIVAQRLLTDDTPVAGFNHPGGSQLIGNYLFLALEDFTNRGSPFTGVWMIDPVSESIEYLYKVDTNKVEPEPLQVLDPAPVGDYHQSTAAVTRLADGTFLLAACVYEKCDYINFYKSMHDSLDPVEGGPDFKLFYQWYRHDELRGLEDDGINWGECGPQNMNFVAETDGEIYLVMFGGVNRGIQGGDLPGCMTGVGYDDHLYAYTLEMHENYEISLSFEGKWDVIPERHICAKGVLAADLNIGKDFHGLNFLAGSGLWIRPDGKDTIAFLATEHYDTCGANVRYKLKDGVEGEGVQAKTRWGVSTNWNDLPDIGKELISGDLVVEVNPAEALQYEFSIAYRGAEQDVVIEDTLPAIWNVSNINGDSTGLPLDCGGSTDFAGSGVIVFKGGKAPKKCRGATHLWWSPLEPSISVGAETIQIPGKGHQLPHYFPGKCGAFYLNDGAVVYPTIDGIPDFTSGPLYVSDSLCLAAVRDLNAPIGIDPFGNGDEDGDWLSDYEEACVNEFSTDPCLADTDADGVNDDVDECPLTGDLGPGVGLGGCPCNYGLSLACPPTDDAQSFIDGLHVQLNGGWTSPDTNCPQVVLATWDWGNGVVDEFSGTPPGPFPNAYTYPGSDTYSIEVKLFDSLSTELDRASCEVSVP
jgi:hypothetical protein